jgi:hypothetical protein
MARHRILDGLPGYGLFPAYGGTKDKQGVPVGTIVQAYRPPYDTIADEVEWVLLDLEGTDTQVLVPYTGSTHIADDQGEPVSVAGAGAGRPQMVEQRLGFPASVIRAAPSHRDPDELSAELRRAAFAHYFPGLNAANTAEVIVASETSMRALIGELFDLPYATGTRPVPRVCVMRDGRGYVGVLRTANENYFKIVDWPFDAPPTQLVAFRDKVGLNVRKGFLPNPDLSTADLHEQAYVVGTLLIDEILSSDQDGTPDFFDLVDPPSDHLLVAIGECLSAGTVVQGAQVRGPAYGALFLGVLTSRAELFGFTSAFVPPPELHEDSVSCERDAVLLDLMADSIIDILDQGPTQTLLVVLDSEHVPRTELGAEVSLRDSIDVRDGHPEVRLRFWGPDAGEDLAGVTTFRLWAGQWMACGAFLPPQ